MNAKSALPGIRAFGLALLAGAVMAGPNLALANGHGGGGGGGGGGHGGGGHGGGGHAYAGHGYGGYGHGYGGYGHGYGGYGRYGYGRGYGYGWGRGYGWGGYGWGGYGWGWPGAFFLATLPLYYSTLWWDGVPYYYADDNYYTWDGTAGGYTAVQPPPEVVNQARTIQQTTELFVYPKNSQTPDQVERDKQECRTWAASQAAAASGNPGDNLRAQTACLEARGYSVR
jgi:hypothetical protein